MHSKSPYGKVLREFNEATDARYLTTHHERDKETGFDYRGARFYDSDLGRFLSLDPLAMEYPSFSDYSYVAGNPIMFIDPTGKSVENTIYVDNDGNEIHISADNLERDAIVEVDPENIALFKEQLAKAKANGTEHDETLNAQWRKLGAAYDVQSMLDFIKYNTPELDNDEGAPAGMRRENAAYMYEVNGLITVGPERYVGGYNWSHWGRNNRGFEYHGGRWKRTTQIHTHPNEIGGGPSSVDYGHTGFKGYSKIAISDINIYFYNRRTNSTPRKDYYINIDKLRGWLAKQKPSK